MAKHQPSRLCVACRQSRLKRDLVRIVRTPVGTIALDPTGKAQGRGAYLCAAAPCWERALKHGILQRALNVTLDEATQAHLQQHAATLPNEL